MGQQWASNGPAMGQQWASNGPAMGQELRLVPGGALVAWRSAVRFRGRALSGRRCQRVCLAQESRRVTVRFSTGLSAVLSGSMQK